MHSRKLECAFSCEHGWVRWPLSSCLLSVSASLSTSSSGWIINCTSSQRSQATTRAFQDEITSATSSCLMAIFHANTRDSQRSNLNLQNTRYSLTNIAEQIPLFFLHTLSDSVKCCRCCKCKCLKCSSTAILFFSTFAPLLSFIWLCSYHCKYFISLCT